MLTGGSVTVDEKGVIHCGQRLPIREIVLPWCQQQLKLVK
jgi:hypothetical protein